MRPGFIDGLVLAAIASEDRAADQVRDGLAPGIRRNLEERLRDLGALERDARHEEVKRLAARLRPVHAGAALPPRATAILAPDVSRELGRKWTAHAPSVRRGYRVSGSLKATLRRFAQPSNPKAERDERRAAERATPLQARTAQAIDPDEERVRGALVLGAEGDLFGDMRSRGWRRLGAELAEIERATWRA